MFLFWKLKSSKAWGVSLIFKDRSQKHLKLNWKLLDKINNQVPNALSLFYGWIMAGYYKNKRINL